MADTSEEFDFLENSSMNELFAKMGEIDKQLAEITEFDKDVKRDETTSSEEKESQHDHQQQQQQQRHQQQPVVDISATISSTPVTDQTPASYKRIYLEDSKISMVSDFEQDEEALASLQDELNQFDAMQGMTITEDEQQTYPPPEPQPTVIPANNTTNTSTTNSATPDEPAASTIVGSGIKPYKDSPIGISMKTIKGVTRIVGIAEDGLLADSGLKPGYQIMQVNGIKIKNAKHARYIIQKSPDKVTFVTKLVRLVNS